MTLTTLLILAVMAGCSPAEQTPDDTLNGPEATAPPSSQPDAIDPDTVPDEDLYIHYLPQGCSIARSGNQVVLMDGCAAEDADAVIGYLKDEMRAERLAQIVVPNMDPGRYSGVEAVMEAIPTALVIIPNGSQTNEFAEFAERISDGLNVLPVQAGSSFNIGSGIATIVGPIVADGEDAMDTTLMIRVSHGNNAFLFPCDASQKEAETLLADTLELRSDVLFANSRNTTTLPYSVLRLISPKYMITANHTTLPDITEFKADVVAASDNAVVIQSNGANVTFSE